MKDLQRIGDVMDTEVSNDRRLGDFPWMSDGIANI